MLQTKRVVITGMGAVCSVGYTPEEIFQATLEGRSGIEPITLYEVLPDHRTRIAAEVKDLDRMPLRNVPIKDVRNRMARGTMFMIYAAQQALEDSGLEYRDLDPEEAQRIGISVGSSFVGMRESLIPTTLKYASKGPGHISPLLSR